MPPQMIMRFEDIEEMLKQGKLLTNYTVKGLRDVVKLFKKLTYYKTVLFIKKLSVPSEGQCILTGESPVMVEARAM